MIYFLRGSTLWLICCFIVILHIERKWHLNRNLATILPLKSKFLENLSILRAPNSDLCEGNYLVPHQIKAFYVSGTKTFERRFTGTYRTLLLKWSENAVSVWLKMLQCKCFFSHQPETVLLEYIFILSEMSFVKCVRVFERNCIVKCVIFVVSFCWFWDFLPENLKLLDKLHIRGF